MADPKPEDDKPLKQSDKVTTGLMIVAALAAIGGFGVLFSVWWRAELTDDYDILRVASQEFVAGHPILAGELAERVVFEEAADAMDEPAEAVPAVFEQDDETPEMMAAKAARAERLEWIRLRDFLVGVGKVAKANAVEEQQERRRLLIAAVPALESAKVEGFPPGRETQGNLILGETLFKLGRYDEAAKVIRDAVTFDPTLQRDLVPMLAVAELNAQAPLKDKALRTIEGLLLESNLRPETRWESELIRIRALIALKRWPETRQAIKVASQIEPSADISLQAKEADFRDQLRLQTAIAEVQQAIDRRGIFWENPAEDRSDLIEELADTIRRLGGLEREASPKIGSQAQLWASRAFLVQGLVDDALAGLTAVRQQRPFGAAAIVAGLEELEILARQGRGVEVLQTTRYMIREIGDVTGFDASIVTFNEFQRRMAGVLAELRLAEQFKYTIDTARSLPPVIEPAEALTQEGIAHREAAVATLANGRNASGQVSRSASVLARSQYRAAGDAFASAAKLLFDTEEYLPTQWSAIDAYQQGRHFSQSIRLLLPYLRYEQRRRKPRGLVAYGRALLAEGGAELAIESLLTCIDEYPRDPLRYDARLLAALAYSEQEDLEKARKFLRDNLEDGDLTPQSPAWRDSLFTLGELLYERGYRDYLIAEQSEDWDEKVELLRENQAILEEAVRALDEAVERYWPLPRAESAAYLASRAHVLSSRWPRIESESTEILDAARRSLRTQAEQQLQTALDGFVRLRKHLLTREEEIRLPENEQRILRNCFIAEADVLQEMNRFDEAASVYRAIELRYMNEPPALEAIVGRANCLKSLGRRPEADLLIKQASVVLDRIPVEWNGRFTETTRYDRDGWKNLLTWMNQRIENAGT